MPRSRRPLLAAAGTVALAATLLAPSSPAAAAPDTDCMRAGLAKLKEAGLLPTVARDGVSLQYAVEVLEVTVRPGADISAVPDPVPLSLLLADHRAGDNSLFVYPWC